MCVEGRSVAESTGKGRKKAREKTAMALGDRGNKQM